MKGKHNSSKAHLFPGKLLPALHHIRRDRVSILPDFGSKALGQQWLPSFTSEELTAFEYKDATPGELRACYAAWRRLLKSVGVDVKESLIESALHGAYGGTRSRKSHEHSIYNAHEVSMLLKEAARTHPWMGSLWQAQGSVLASAMSPQQSFNQSVRSPS